MAATSYNAPQPAAVPPPGRFYSPPEIRAPPASNEWDKEKPLPTGYAVFFTVLFAMMPAFLFCFLCFHCLRAWWNYAPVRNVGELEENKRAKVYGTVRGPASAEAPAFRSMLENVDGVVAEMISVIQKSNDPYIPDKILETASRAVDFIMQDKQGSSILVTAGGGQVSLNGRYHMDATYLKILKVVSGRENRALELARKPGVCIEYVQFRVGSQVAVTGTPKRGGAPESGSIWVLPSQGADRAPESGSIWVLTSQGVGGLNLEVRHAHWA